MGTVVITGANSGIGLGAARLLGRDGHRVVMAVRDTAKGERAAQSVDGGAEVRKLDLTDLASVRAFADGWDEPIDVLINNAGIMAVPFGRTKDGFELQVGTNHLGHFALTNLLLPHVRDRVVTVASVAHRFGGVDLDDLNFERRRYDRWRAYAQSKLANLLFVLELQRRLLEADSDVLAVAAHPGYAATNLQSHTGTRIEHLVMKLGNALIGQSIEHGARDRRAVGNPAGRRLDERRTRRGQGPRAVGAVGGADRRHVPRRAAATRALLTRSERVTARLCRSARRNRSLSRVS
jgi:NAD(P)-dependent dehydrogenase (short-subunit alcohol dehydrogenase family)